MNTRIANTIPLIQHSTSTILTDGWYMLMFTDP